MTRLNYCSGLLRRYRNGARRQFVILSLLDYAVAGGIVCLILDLDIVPLMQIVGEFAR